MSPGIELEIPARASAPATPAYASLPAHATRGVVVIHEIMGRQPEIDRVVERFAAHGYAAIAPDLFARGRLPCIVDFFRQGLRHGRGVGVDQCRAAREQLVESAGIARERVGIIGFCFGGGFALAAGQGWGAVSTNYGNVPETKAMTGIGPVIGCYGKRDRIFGHVGATLRQRLAPLNVSPEVHEYDAGHSFLTDGHHPIAHRLAWPMAIADHPEAREDAWAKIFAFFDSKL